MFGTYQQQWKRLREHSREVVAGCHTRRVVVETVGRFAGVGPNAGAVVAADGRVAVVYMAGLGRVEGMSSVWDLQHSRGQAAAGGDRRRQGQRSSWRVWIGLVVKPWAGVRYQELHPRRNRRMGSRA